MPDNHDQTRKPPQSIELVISHHTFFIVVKVHFGTVLSFVIMQEYCGLMKTEGLLVHGGKLTTY